MHPPDESYLLMTELSVGLLLGLPTRKMYDASLLACMFLSYISFCIFSAQYSLG